MAEARNTGPGRNDEGSGASGIGRIAALAAVLAAVALVAIVLFGGASDSYTVKARFLNGGQLVKGNPVQMAGAPVGSVGGIKITEDGQAEVEFEVDEDHAPLRRGTRAAIRQFSQSGIANRYIHLVVPPSGAGEIPDGGTIGTDSTRTAVDLDQLFNTLDPRTRKALQGFFKGQARQFRGRGEPANRGLQYLNPALATSSRLFSELTRDTPVLERFLVDSSKLVTTIAERRDDLAALVGNLNSTTRALGSEKQALAESVGLLPPFMRRANTTFVNLRAALDDVDPLVDASKPVAKRLGPFLTQARAFASDAEPTVRDLQVTIRRRGRRNDLINFVDSVPPLTRIAVDSAQRNGEERRGAFPESADALNNARPLIGVARPYTTDFLGWLDDFSTTGGGFDALGAYARAHISVAENIFGPVRTGQFKRCPGSAEAPADDGSNVFSEEQQRELNCEESARATGDVP